jgi:hypothetical protein
MNPNTTSYPAASPPSYSALCLAGLRAAALQPIAWSSLPRCTPWDVLAWLLASRLISVLGQALLQDEAHTLNASGLAMAWLGPLALAWACWAVTRSRDARGGTPSPDGATAFTVLMIASAALHLALTLLFVVLIRSGRYDPETMEPSAAWIIWWFSITWWALIIALVLMRAGRANAQRMSTVLAAIVVAITAFVSSSWLAPAQYWFSDFSDTASAAYNEDDDEGPSTEHLTPEALEAQMEVLPRTLAGLARPRPGVVDVYVVTYAPYSAEDVFLNEGEVMDDVMRSRFGAEGRVVQLVNHSSTSAQHAWATPDNLRRTLTHLASIVNKDEDIVLVHLASHGGKDATLETQFWPLTIDALNATMLRNALDEAGIKHRVISVSACYAGTWLPALQSPDTLVLTAADAEHTSYGCGHESDLTYFTKAVFDEQLRETFSFEKALAQARPIIEQREIAGGKTDGFSNPQISIGSAIAPLLARLEAELKRGPGPHSAAQPFVK